MKRFFPAVTILITLGGCEPNEVNWAGAGVGGSTIVRSAPSSSQSTARNSHLHSQYDDGEPKLVSYPVETVEDCRKMRQRLEQEGYRYKQLRANPNQSRWARWLCEFEAPQGEYESPWEDKRYNSADEYSASPSPHYPEPIYPRKPEPDLYRQPKGYARKQLHPNPRHKEFRRSRYRRERPTE
jgi:hypothetical protein